MATPKQLILNVNPIPGGVYSSGWLTGTRPPRSFIEIEHFAEIARIAERGKFDAMFLADLPYWVPRGEHQPFRPLDPVVVLSYVAAITTHLGLIVTASTSYNTPYNLARRMLTLDHVSQGRAGWNFVVTAGDAAARNFSLDAAPPKEARYERANEFIEIVKALWSCWEPDGLLADPESVRYVDVAKVHAINYAGKHFRVDGPLITPPSAQGSPVLVEAGGSEGGTELAGRFAHAVYSTQPTLEGARAYRQALRRRAQAHGRSPDTIKLLPGLITVIGETEAQAQAHSEYLLNLLPLRIGIARLAEQLKVSEEVLAEHLDRTFPLDLFTQKDFTGVGHREVLLRQIRDERLSLRQTIARSSAIQVHATAIGSPEQVADQLQRWLEQEAVDGFNVMPAELPRGFTDFVDLVVPELQRRGLFRTEYETHTLRGHYGLGIDD